MMDTAETTQPGPLSHVSNDKNQPIEYSEIHKTSTASNSTTGRLLAPPVGENTESATLAPPERVRKRSKPKKLSPTHQRQSNSSYSAAGDDAPHTYNRRNAVSSEPPLIGVRCESPEDSTPELQPYPSPEHGLRESIHNIGVDDWNSKCDGLMGIRRVAVHHPEVLLPQLHTVVLAVEKEVEK